jgi:hypothetical protein
MPPAPVHADASAVIRKAVDMVLNPPAVKPKALAQLWLDWAADAEKVADAVDAQNVCMHGRMPTHEPTCPTLNPPAQSRADAEQAADAAVAALPEQFRDVALAPIMAQIAAQYDCNCRVAKGAATGARRNGSTRGERVATDKMSAYVRDKSGANIVRLTDAQKATSEGPYSLRVVFASGPEAEFVLPYDTADKAATKVAKAAALKWAVEHGATEGQRAAVVKALTDNGWKVGA